MTLEIEWVYFAREGRYMANQEQLQILGRGVESWNRWRRQNRKAEVDLSGASLNGAVLREANFSGADLREATLYRADLRGADIRGANLSGMDLRKMDLSGADLSGASLNRANLSGMDLRGMVLSGADLWGANLKGADLRGATLYGANLYGANLSGANLSGMDLRGMVLREMNLRGANLKGTNLSGMDLRGMDLREKDLSGANLSRANLSGMDLRGMDLRETDLSRANLKGVSLRRTKLLVGVNLSGVDLSGMDLSGMDLSGANLSGANLSRTLLIETNLNQAIITGCSIYGISAWNLNLERAEQKNLIITPKGEPEITVDDIEVAQFIHLLLSNEKIRRVIDTMTSKAVLILGRFTTERKIVVDALRETLRSRGYLPILFDFEKPASRDLTETISTLAHMARFVIADITDAKSIPQELQRIVPDLPSVPVQPIIAASDHEYAIFESIRRYPWVLPVYLYDSQDALLVALEEKVILPAEAKAKEQAAR